MAYTVSARKWRPQAFAELVGQAAISQTLINALKADRLPQALVFTGPRGTGKTSTARILAKTLRCSMAKDFVPCGQCSDCIEIAESRSVDVMEIDGASNNGVDAIRELRDSVAYRPARGRYKIIIIDEVHMLSNSAFNALLKTIEEPPEHLIFIFATTEVHKIPDTILSRCQRFDFRRIPTALIVKSLEGICQSEGHTYEIEALWAVARKANGSLRDSQSLLDQVVNFSNAQITRANAHEILGITDSELLLKTVTAAANESADEMLDAIEKFRLSGIEPETFAEDLLEMFRHILICTALSDERLNQMIDLPETDIAHLRSLAQKTSSQWAQVAFDMALKINEDLRRTEHSALVLEVGLFRLLDIGRVFDVVNHWSTAPTLAQIPAGGARAAAPQKPVAIASEMNMPERDKNWDWPELVRQITGVNPILGSQLEHVFLASDNGRMIELSYPAQFQFLSEVAKNPEIARRIKNYLKTFAGVAREVKWRAPELKPQTSTAEAPLTPREIANQKQLHADQELRRKIENHPLVKSAQNVFKSNQIHIKEIKSEG